MKVISKNFIYILKKFKTASILNILGLSAAFVVFIIAMIQVDYDFSFDRHFKRGDDIVLYNEYATHRDENKIWISTPKAKRDAEKTPLIEDYAIIGSSGSDFRLDGDRKIYEERWHVSSGFIDLFEPTVLEGDIVEALSDPAKVALSESTAEKFFGTKHALGRTFSNYYNNYPVTVVAIIKDFPKNSTFGNGIYTYLNDDEETEAGYNVYYLVREENQKIFKEFLNSKDFLGQEYYDEIIEDPRTTLVLNPIQFSSIHLHFPEKGEGDLGITIAMMTIAILIIIIAFINYINFSIAMAPARVKALNIQNILGATKDTQRRAIVSESIIFSFLALAIALVVVHFIHTSPLQELFSADLGIAANATRLAIMCGILLVVSVLLGLYPAKYATSFDATSAIKGSSMTVISSTKLRNTLITIQFASAIALVVIATFIKIQHDYMVNYSWGIQKENILYFDRVDKNINIKTFCEELIKDPRIVDYTTSRFAPGEVSMTWGIYVRDVYVSIACWPVRENFLDFFGVKMREGRNFSKESPHLPQIIVNQKFLDKYEFTSDIIGDSLYVFEGNAEIRGVAENINFQSLKVAIRPMIFLTLASQKEMMIFLKITGQDIPGALSFIKDSWGKISKEMIDIRFLDEKLDNLYKTENNIAKMVGIFSLITILIAIMGVYGLITFNSRYRAKEIAIRKVQGSTEKEIMILLNRSLLTQFAIGFVIAVPVSYFAVSKWLEQFAYKTPIYWWVFLLGALLVLIITLITVSIQSYKAASLNPATTLKNE